MNAFRTFAWMLLILGPATAQEKVPAPPEPSKHPWLKWKTGAFVKFELTVERGGDRGGGVEVDTLVDRTETGFLVKAQREFVGEAQSSETRHQLPQKTADEEITVEGKKILCAVWESKGVRDLAEIRTRIWIDETTGGILRFAQTNGADGSRLDLAAVALSEEIPIGDRKISCVKLTGRKESDDGMTTDVTMWASPEVPGGVTRYVSSFKMGGFPTVATLQAVEYQDGK